MLYLKRFKSIKPAVTFATYYVYLRSLLSENNLKKKYIYIVVRHLGFSLYCIEFMHVKQAVP